MGKHSSKKSFLRDFSGAFGDVGVFMPLALGMIIICGLSPTAVFLPAGLLYLISGWYYKIPFPVQPLKAVAAIALVNALRPELIATTAYLMAALMVLFLLFDFSRSLNTIFSKPIVRGIQFGLGMLLITSGMSLILKGEIISGVPLPDIQFSGFYWGSSTLSLFVPALNDIATALVVLLIPQIPLTLGNSMVATADLARGYFGKRAQRVTYRNLAGTIGVGNLLAGLVGGMPVCHGCGGLTAHYRFGARTARANFVIGSVFLVLALLCAQVSPFLLSGIPLSVFGMALMVVGIFHALLARDVKTKNDIAIVAVMGVTTLFYKNLTMALCAGLLLREILQFGVYYKRLSNLSAWVFSKGQNRGESFRAGYRGTGKPVTAHPLLDRHNRKIAQLRITVTEDQHLKSLYTVPHSVSRKEPERRILSNGEICRLSQIAVNLGIGKIRISGGEPLLREGVVSLIASIASLNGLKELSLATDGILLNTFACPLHKAGLQKVHVTLDTLKQEKFEAITGGKKLTDVTAGIGRAQDAGLAVKVNVVVLKGINDGELEDFIRFGKAHNVTVRFIEYIPIVLSPRQQHYFMSRDEIVKKVSPHLNGTVHSLGRDSIPAHYLPLAKGGEVGIITPVSHGLCGRCNRLKLSAGGYLSSCLVNDVCVDLGGPLRNGEEDETIAALFKRAILLKPEQGMCALRENTIRSTL